MAPANYYSKKELTKIGVEGFALIDEFYGGGRKGRKQQQLSNYRGHANTYMVTSRSLPPPPPPAAATPISHYSTASSSGYSRRLQYEGYNYHRYSPAESHVGWTPVVSVMTETTTVIRGGYEAGKLHDGEIIMDDYMY